MTPTQIAAKLKKVKLGDSFPVSTVNERMAVLQAAKLCRRFGFISFRIRTWKNKNGGFTATAVPE